MHIARASIIAAALAGALGNAQAQTFPSKPIRLIAAEPGGSGDMIARIAAQGLSDAFKQQAVVENYKEAVEAAVVAAKAAPDGYSLSTSGNSIWLLPFLQDKPPVDPFRDFDMVVMTTTSPAVMAINPGFTATSVKDVIDMARAKPGELKAATATLGSITQLSLELFRTMTATNFQRVTYKGAVPALNGLVDGEVQFMFLPANLGAAQMKAGKIKPIGVAATRQTNLFPGLPTIGASGLPGYESSAFQVVFAPARTPAAILEQLNRAIVQHINKPDVKEKLFVAGLDVVGASPAKSMEIVKSEVDRIGKVIRDAGLKAPK